MYSRLPQSEVEIVHTLQLFESSFENYIESGICRAKSRQYCPESSIAITAQFLYSMAFYRNCIVVITRPVRIVRMCATYSYTRSFRFFAAPSGILKVCGTDVVLVRYRTIMYIM